MTSFHNALALRAFGLFIATNAIACGRESAGDGGADSALQPETAVVADARSEVDSTAETVPVTETDTPVDASFSPVCGTDDITYWNAAQAAAKGVGVASTGQCTKSAGGPWCGGACPPGTICVVDSSAFPCAATDVYGHCWKIPADASCPSGTDKYRNCTTSKCSNYCNAVKSGTIHFDGTCP